MRRWGETSYVDIGTLDMGERVVDLKFNAMHCRVSRIVSRYNRSDAEQQYWLSTKEWFTQSLKLPYRISKQVTVDEDAQRISSIYTAYSPFSMSSVPIDGNYGLSDCVT